MRDTLQKWCSMHPPLKLGKFKYDPRAHYLHAMSVVCEEQHYRGLLRMFKARAKAKAAPLYPIEKSSVTRCLVDLGGICAMDRKIYTWSIDGLEVLMPANQVGEFIGRLARIEPKHWAIPGSKTAAAYELVVYPVPAMVYALLLSKKQIGVLLEHATQVRAEAEEIADRENAAFNKRFVENPHPHIDVKPRPVRAKAQ